MQTTSSSCGLDTPESSTTSISVRDDLPDGDEHVHPNLPIFDGVPEVSHIEFVRQPGSVVDKSSRDFISLVLSEKLRRRWVIAHDEKRDDSNDECDDTFNDLQT